MSAVPPPSPPSTSGQTGIQGGEYSVSADLQINGESVNWHEIEVEMNAFALSSMVTARGPMDGGDPNEPTPPDAIEDMSRVTDWIAVTQANAKASQKTPWSVLVGYTSSSSGPGAGLMQLETGFLDEANPWAGGNEWEFIGRSTAMIFEQNPTAQQLAQNTNSLAFIELMFSQLGIPLVVAAGAGAGNVVLGNAYDDPNYQRSLRNASIWQYMQDAALAQGMKLSIHNGVGYYGPYGGDNPPTIVLSAFGDFDEDGPRIQHTADRSHAITVEVDSSNPRTNDRVVGRYSSGSGETQTYRFFIAGLDRHKAQGEAYAIWHDLVTKELILRGRIIPDAAFMQMLAQRGSDFLIQLTDFLPSTNQLYHVQSARLIIDATSADKTDLSVEIIAANHVPLAGVGSYG